MLCSASPSSGGKILHIVPLRRYGETPTLTGCSTKEGNTPGRWCTFVCFCPLLCASVRLPVRGADRVARVGDAVPLLHGPALRSGAPLPLPHPAAVHPQRDQHPEVHQVSSALLVCTAAVCPVWFTSTIFLLMGSAEDFWALSQPTCFLCIDLVSRAVKPSEQKTHGLLACFAGNLFTLDCSDLDIRCHTGKYWVCTSKYKTYSLICADCTYMYEVTRWSVWPPGCNPPQQLH